jgi:hypothetical protein
MAKHDFLDGRGQVPAHKHTNGGGWVADTARVDASAYVGPDAQVCGNAKVYGHAQLYGDARVYDYAKVYGHAQVYGNAHAVKTVKEPVDEAWEKSRWVSGDDEEGAKAPAKTPAKTPVRARKGVRG